MIFRRFAQTVILLTVGALAIAAQKEVTVAELIDAVHTGIHEHTADKAQAKSIGKASLSERLDWRVIEELESQGAGRETIAVLHDLHELSAASLAVPMPPMFAVPTAPSIEEQKAAFRSISANAVRYAGTLPDFICTESIRRYTRDTGRKGPFVPNDWNAHDALTVKLTYFENREKYELTHINGRPAARGYEASGGAVSEGDFGSILLEIFVPETQTKFQWDHWTRLRNRLTSVYLYRTPQQHSHYRIGVGNTPDSRNSVIAGRSGFIYADNETHMVMRVTGQADSIPPNFPVISQSNLLDYDYAEVGGVQVLLPLRAEMRMLTPRMRYKNVVEFQGFRKFSAESSITFDK